MLTYWKVERDYIYFPYNIDPVLWLIFTFVWQTFTASELLLIHYYELESIIYSEFFDFPFTLPGFHPE